VAIADSYDGFLIDLDGVVWLGHDPIDGAADALGRLGEAGKPFVFVTNSPRISPAEQARILNEHGIETDESRVVTAGTALLGLAAESLPAGAAVLATGTSGFREQVRGAGYEILPAERWDEARGVLVTGHPGFDYDELKATAMAARTGVFFAATGRDPTMPMPDGLWPGTGSILAAIETAAGREAAVAGKPQRPIFDSGVEVLGLPEGARIAMIGDRIDTDVAGAQRAGLDGILVRGNASATAPDVIPDHEIESLRELLG